MDALTGPAIGRAKSATFRTADIAGVDVALKVSDNLYDAVPDDPAARGLQAARLRARRWSSAGWLGEKTGGGFYRKEGKEIRTLDWKTLEYRERQKPKFAAVEAAQNVADLGARINQIMAAQGQGGHVPLARALRDQPLRRRRSCPRSPTTSSPSTARWSGATAGGSGPSG